MEENTSNQTIQKVEEALDTMMERFNHHLRHRLIDVHPNGIRSAAINVGLIEDLMSETKTTILTILDDYEEWESPDDDYPPLDTTD